MYRPTAALLRTLLALAIVPGASSRAADEVIIYRCTDASGHLTLRDTPCTGHQQQQTRTMLRPRDAPAAAVERARAPTTAAAAPADAPPRVVVISAPRPLYECVTPDGDRYTSDSDQGNPRWVPLWTLYPMVPRQRGMIAGNQLAITSGNVQLQAGNTVIQPPLAVPTYAYGAGTWIRDSCHALPQAEVCDHLRDRRDEIDHRFFNAMPSERDTLRSEERGINARLDNDCGGH